MQPVSSFSSGTVPTVPQLYHITNFNGTQVLNLFVDKMTDEQLEVYKAWQEARANKDFAAADVARAKLVEWKLV